MDMAIFSLLNHTTPIWLVNSAITWLVIAFIWQKMATKQKVQDSLENIKTSIVKQGESLEKLKVDFDSRMTRMEDDIKQLLFYNNPKK